MAEIVDPKTINGLSIIEQGGKRSVLVVTDTRQQWLLAQVVNRLELFDHIQPIDTGGYYDRSLKTWMRGRPDSQPPPQREVGSTIAMLAAITGTTTKEIISHVEFDGQDPC